MSDFVWFFGIVAVAFFVLTGDITASVAWPVTAVMGTPDLLIWE